MRRPLPRAEGVKVLPVVRPNEGIRVAYEKRMTALITEMHNSVLYWVSQDYNSNPPELAQDALPADILQRAFRRLAQRWTKRFNEMAPKMAEYFATKAADRADGAMQTILRDAGWSVKFQKSRAVMDVHAATLAENVGLIKSIPQQYLLQVEGMVMRSVQAGRDLAPLAKEIEERYGLTKRRAALIARDQNNKATSVITRARQIELGITEAIWYHSTAGKEPRPTHVAANGQRYDVRKGLWDADERKWVLPGQLINCRCMSQSIIPGFN